SRVRGCVERYRHASSQRLREQRGSPGDPGSPAKKAPQEQVGRPSGSERGGLDPDAFLNVLYPVIKFLYAPWFNLFALVMVGIMTVIFIGHWDVIWHDTMEFYNLTDKGWWDFIQVWLLFSFVAFFHESAHGCTVKHYGGGVHSMGFMLMYFLP